MPPKRGAAKAKKGKASDDSLVISRELRKCCPDCGGTNIIFDAQMAQVICHDCGQMFEELPDDVRSDSDYL